MKLEDLLDNRDIASIDSLGSNVRDTVEEAANGFYYEDYNFPVRKNPMNTGFVVEAVAYKYYDPYDAKTIAEGLAHVAAYTKDKEAVIESAKTIGKYNNKENAMLSIIRGLAHVAESTRDGDTIIESAKLISKYSGDTASVIADRLVRVADSTKDKRTVQLACRIINLIGRHTFDLLEAKHFETIRRDGLNELINDRKSLESVAIYVKSDLKMPAPTKTNIGSYTEIASKYISEIYGINKSLNTDKILTLVSVDDRKRRELVGLINDSDETGLKTYSISDEGTKKLEIDRSRLPYLSLIAVTGSRDKALDREAYDSISYIVGEKAIRNARNAFNSSCRSKMSEIASYVNKGRLDKAIDSLRAAKNGSIDDVLGCVNHSYSGFMMSRAVLSAVETNNPLDYDSRVQIACVYLPGNFDMGMRDYCKDYYSKDKKEGFILVRYDIGGKSLGSAICYMKDDTFLVDSVEGHRTFRKPQIFKAVYQDLVDRAAEKGAKRVIFSGSGANETPKNFIKFLGDLGLANGSIKMELDTEGYLEAEVDGVKGYIVDLNFKV